MSMHRIDKSIRVCGVFAVGMLPTLSPQRNLRIG
jgi:hypothetical protein